MTFRQAVEATAIINDKYCPGLQALSAADRARISINDTKKLRGSVDLDSAFEPTQKHARRWDYAVAAKVDRERIYWVEVHPASNGEIDRVLAKLSWLRAWLGGDGVALNAFPKLFVWLSSGTTTFTPGAPKLKSLARVGLVVKGRHLHLK